MTRKIEFDRQEVEWLRQVAGTMSLRAIAVSLGCSPATVWRRMQELEIIGRGPGGANNRRLAPWERVDLSMRLARGESYGRIGRALQISRQAVAYYARQRKSQ